ncbi:MAG: hypothetical protein CMK95_00520 [Pseudomonas sp.]|nr:hypothetical protein [Pseudomonas sp.]
MKEVQITEELLFLHMTVGRVDTTLMMNKNHTSMRQWNFGMGGVLENMIGLTLKSMLIIMHTLKMLSYRKERKENMMNQ